MKSRKAQKVITEWLGGLSPNTRTSYQKTVDDFIEHLGSNWQRDRINKKTIESYIDNLTPSRGSKGRPCKSISQSTKIQRLTCLNTMFKKLLQAGCIETNPSKRVDMNLNKDESLHDVESDRKLVLKGLRKINRIGDPVLRARDRAICLLILNNALKRGEIVSIQLKQLQKGKLIINYPAKGEQEIALNATTQEAIEDWLKVRESKCPNLFVSYARKHQGEKPMSDTAVRELTKKYFECSPQQLRLRSIKDFWNNSAGDIKKTQNHARHLSMAFTSTLCDSKQNKRVAKSTKSRYQPRYH